jgi:hypothetical protein
MIGYKKNQRLSENKKGCQQSDNLFIDFKSINKLKGIKF